MREPRTGSRIPAGYFLGYSSHKSFIRLKTFANFDFITHRWRGFLRSPRNMEFGNILHFDMLDANYFAAKFRQRQQGIILKVFYLRYRLAHVARNSSDSEIREFFEKYHCDLRSGPDRPTETERNSFGDSCGVELHASRECEESSYARS